MCVCVCVCERMCSLKNVFEQIFDVNIFNEIFCDIHIFKTFVYVSVCLSASLTVCLSVCVLHFDLLRYYTGRGEVHTDACTLCKEKSETWKFIWKFIYKEIVLEREGFSLSLVNLDFSSVHQYIFRFLWKSFVSIVQIFTLITIHKYIGSCKWWVGTTKKSQ